MVKKKVKKIKKIPRETSTGLSLKAEKQEIRYFVDKLDKKEMREIAEKHKAKIFGFFTGILSKEKEKQEIKLVRVFKRFDPFWHIIAESTIDYERASKYKINVDKEVKALRIGNAKFNAEDGNKLNSVLFNSTDICKQRRRKEILIDGSVEVKNPNNIKHNSRFEKYLDKESKKIRDIQDNLEGKGVVVTPVMIKVAFILRSILQEIINPVDADKILKENIEIQKLTLYFKPSYLFEYEHPKKNIRRYVSVNSITGYVVYGKDIERIKSRQPFTETALFEVGGEALSTLVPGGEAAFRIFMHMKNKRKYSKVK